MGQFEELKMAGLEVGGGVSFTDEVTNEVHAGHVIEILDDTKQVRIKKANGAVIVVPASKASPEKTEKLRVVSSAGK